MYLFVIIVIIQEKEMQKREANMKEETAKLISRINTITGDLKEKDEQFQKVIEEKNAALSNEKQAKEELAKVIKNDDQLNQYKTDLDAAKRDSVSIDDKDFKLDRYQV